MAVAACSRAAEQPPARPSADAQARALAEAYLDGFFERNPDVYPGQATADMLGSIEIRAARDAANQAMGPRFDIKQFHDRVLEDDAVPVSFLREKIRAWGQTT